MTKDALAYPPKKSKSSTVTACLTQAAPAQETPVQTHANMFDEFTSSDDEDVEDSAVVEVEYTETFKLGLVGATSFGVSDIVAADCAKDSFLSSDESESGDEGNMESFRSQLNVTHAGESVLTIE